MANSNSAEEMTKRRANIGAVPEPPMGCTLINAEERTWWANYTSIWEPDDWRTADLIVVYKIIEIERELKRQKEALDHEGDMVENARGTPMMNPRIACIKQLHDQTISFMRAIGYFADASMKQDKNKRGAEQDAAKRAAAKDGPRSLLAKRG